MSLFRVTRPAHEKNRPLKVVLICQSPWLHYISSVKDTNQLQKKHQRRELISARKSSHEQNQNDLSCLW